MENGEWLMVNLIGDDRGGALLRRRREIKYGVIRARGNSERLQKGEIVIRGMHLFHRAIDELVVKTRAEFRFGFPSMRKDRAAHVSLGRFFAIREWLGKGARIRVKQPGRFARPGNVRARPRSPGLLK